jgi:hypothetical protein
MNDCMVKALDRFYEQEYRHTLFPLFRTEGEKALRHEIVTRFRDRVLTIDQLKQHLMQESMLLVRGKAYRDAVLELKRSGQAEQLDRGSIHHERTRFRLRPQPPAASAVASDGSGTPLSLDLTWP